MSLEQLAKDIAAEAAKEAKAIVSEAEAQAANIASDAQSEVKDHASSVLSGSDMEASQIAKESVASARQMNQKDVLVARREEIDITLEAVRSQLGNPKLAKRSSMLDSMLKQAKSESTGKMTLLPATIDRAALEQKSSGFTIGEDIVALGGFILVAEDNSIRLDFTFDNRLEEVWMDSLGDVTRTLFGE
jgi:vacuolar-type H+-ATPase subunit E/Vma4